MSSMAGGHWRQPLRSQEPPLALSRLHWSCQPRSMRIGVRALWVPHDALGSTGWQVGAEQLPEAVQSRPRLRMPASLTAIPKAWLR